MPAPIPTYRRRLQIEGAQLALLGAASAVLVLAFGADATHRLWSTALQVAVVAALMVTLGVRSVRRSLARATAVDAVPGRGEPTGLWILVAIVASLTLSFGFVASWDAGLRIGLGCVVVGLAQAVLFERVVALEEERVGGRFHRIAGSSLLKGTRLAVTDDRR